MQVLSQTTKISVKMEPEISIYDLFQNYKDESFEAELVDFGEDVGFEVIGN